MTHGHTNGQANGCNDPRQPVEDVKPLARAKEAEDLLTAVQQLVTNFIQKADDDASSKSQGENLDKPVGGPRSVLLEPHAPTHLQKLLGCALPEHGLGRDGFVDMVKTIFQYSVNIWDQGFLDKLYATTTPVGLAADLVLSSLNTNVHVYQVSPALTIIEKQTGRALAEIFGFQGANAGGVTQPGGSAANQSSMVIARNNLFPETKTEGNGSRRFVLFTSAHGHYSVEKAAQMLGFGSQAVRAVDVDERGRMIPAALDAAIEQSKQRGETPFYINATAGTTVLGSFDPIDHIAPIARKHHLWLHVDGSWGGSVVFSDKLRHKLKGVELADSVSICPHKMINVPLTCSFLLGKDLREFHKGMTLPAGYLFHNTSTTDDDDQTGNSSAIKPEDPPNSHEPHQEFWDLADLTPQCGRRGDSLKLALTWIYYGTAGFRAYIDDAFDTAAELARLVAAHPKFTLVSENPPPCLQVCFYYAKQDVGGEGKGEGEGEDKEENKEMMTLMSRKKKENKKKNSEITEKISQVLIPRGFMTDFAPGEDGKFFRVVVNGQTRKETVRGLVRAIEEIGEQLRL